jgi:hypothetical protein
MRFTIAVAILGLAACSSPSKVPKAPLGASQHLAEANRHEADARHHEELANEAEARESAGQGFTCGDRALADQATSGGEKLAPRGPCWTSEREDIARHRAVAQSLRVDARAHRALARQLVGVARDACESLPENDLARSPFSHREDIASVEAVLDGDHVRGARVRFRPISGLNAAWLERSLTCHQALAAASGYAPTYMSQCPAAVRGAQITASDTPAGAEVEIRSEEVASALVIYARAEAAAVR